MLFVTHNAQLVTQLRNAREDGREEMNRLQEDVLCADQNMQTMRAELA